MTTGLKTSQILYAIDLVRFYDQSVYCCVVWTESKQKAHTVIPAHLVAEAISTLHGLDLRWSGPITPTEMQYVQQYVFAKYPEYCNGLVEESEKFDFYSLCINEDSSDTMSDDKKKSPKIVRESSFVANTTSDMSRVQLEPSKLLDILAKKTSFQGNFMSIPEIQARNQALQNCGLTEDDYLVVFTASVREAMMMESKVIIAPETWLDLRIKGSQLSQYFRRKCKHSPKGLFAYSACTNGARSSMHWISEAHRNAWHVLLDATALDVGKDRLALALHRPDFVMCVVDIARSQPSKITCLLVRKNSFDAAATSA
ncbi:UNVERIFIED_CONTAM: hypothetical protein Slati_3179600 [Sesamum latifolium]|uniref:Molybdenum cofactor sulfurase n=1 Tax=Sesamum latifolium TaxID=2727402 RepID=A0AAW2UXE9_9LAMI